MRNHKILCLLVAFHNVLVLPITSVPPERYCKSFPFFIRSKMAGFNALHVYNPCPFASCKGQNLLLSMGSMDSAWGWGFMKIPSCLCLWYIARGLMVKRTSEWILLKSVILFGVTTAVIRVCFAAFAFSILISPSTLVTISSISLGGSRNKLSYNTESGSRPSLKAIAANCGSQLTCRISALKRSKTSQFLRRLLASY